MNNYNEQVKVYKTEKVVVLEVTEPWSQKNFFNGQPFRTVKFLRESGEVIQEGIFDGVVCHRLMMDGDLAQGATAVLRSEISPNHWIVSINGKDWH